MKRLLILVPIILTSLSSCNNGTIKDNVGEPYQAKLSVNQLDDQKNLNVDILVDFSGFGGVPATVTLYSDNTPIGSTSERVALKASAESPWDYKYSITIPRNFEKHSYYAKVEWLKSSKSMSIVTQTVVFP